jgi:hypothetical protein
MPPTFAQEVYDANAEAGFDSANAIQSRITDMGGVAEFLELVSGKYIISILSEYYENVDSKQYSLVVPASTLEVRVAPMYYAVAQVTGDYLYNYAVTTDSSPWVSITQFSRSTDRLQQALRQEFPNSLVYVATPVSPTPTLNVDGTLLLARSGKRDIHLQLAPALEHPKPLVIDVPGDPSGYANVASVRFEVQDAAGHAVQCSDLLVAKDNINFPVGIRLGVERDMQLPIGHWSIVTHSDALQGHFTPTECDVVSSVGKIVIRLDQDVVPVRVVIRGYRGECPSFGWVEVSQSGVHATRMGMADMHRLDFCLQPGEANWTVGASGYKPTKRSVLIRPVSNVEPQVIEFELEVG